MFRNHSEAGGPPFKPHRLVRNRHVQSVLASSSLRRRWLTLRGPLALEEVAREVVLDCGADVRLQGFLSEHSGEPTPPGLVVLIHGWEGCAWSNYILAVGEALYRAGFDVFRLHLRDHGESHSLNEEIFHSNRIDEAVGAVAAVERLLPERPLFLAGFSLGGNFALRIALRAPGAGIRLRHTIAVNPALDPDRVCDAIDRFAIYRIYFLRKWRRSLLRKQAAFPELYDFSGIDRIRTVREMTERILADYGGYRSIQDYFAGYTLTGDALEPLAVPTTILTSRDDPIIGFDDFRRLPRGPALLLEAHDHGGHCGYIEGPSLRSWLERRIVELVEEDQPMGPSRRLSASPLDHGRRQSRAK